MILRRLRERRDSGGLGGALVKGGFVIVKASKLILGLASFAAYTFLFTWQFAVIILGMLVIHEFGHLRCMKHYGMKTRGIYLIPLLGAAAVAEDDFPSRRAETTVALAGPLTGAALAAGTGLLYFATGNGAFAAAAAWMALINLFNLLPVVPLDGGRVVKSITCSIGSRTGLAAVIAGMLLGAVLAFAADLWIFVIVIPLGLLDYLYDRDQTMQAERRPRRRISKRRASRRHAPSGRHALSADALAAVAVRVSDDEPDGSNGVYHDKNDAGQTAVRSDAVKTPLSPRAAQVAFAAYSGLAVLLWLFILAMGHQPGAVAAMHALQG
jgi:Zn-dependent protease